MKQSKGINSVKNKEFYKKAESFIDNNKYLLKEIIDIENAVISVVEGDIPSLPVILIDMETNEFEIGTYSLSDSDSWSGREKQNNLRARFSIFCYSDSSFKEIHFSLKDAFCESTIELENDSEIINSEKISFINKHKINNLLNGYKKQIVDFETDFDNNQILPSLKVIFSEIANNMCLDKSFNMNNIKIEVKEPDPVYVKDFYYLNFSLSINEDTEVHVATKNMHREYQILIDKVFILRNGEKIILVEEHTRDYMPLQSLNLKFGLPLSEVKTIENN